MSTLLMAVVSLSSCVPLSTRPGVEGPEVPSELTATAGTSVPTVLETTAVVFNAEAAGGEAPYLFRWDLNAGPVELALTNVTSDTLTTDPLTTPGRYVFRVVVTDGQGSHASDFVAVEVTDAVTASAPSLAVVGDPAELTATLDPAVEDASLLWEVVRGTASLDGPSSAAAQLTTTTGETVEVTLTVTLAPDSPAPATTTRSFEIVSVVDLHPRVLVDTNLGAFTIELDAELAPLHAVNFLLYADEAFYDDLLFHRNVCVDVPDAEECEPFVLQGGGYKRVDGELELQEPTRDAVPSEADNGLSNGALYSVAMALSGFPPDRDSGATEFFINLGDNSDLDEQGFTVFGTVVNGTDTVDAITASERTDSPIIPGEVSFPAEDVIIEQISRVRP